MHGLAAVRALGAELRRKARRAREAVAFSLAVARHATRTNIVRLVNHDRVHRLGVAVVWRVGFGRRAAGRLSMRESSQNQVNSCSRRASPHLRLARSYLRHRRHAIAAPLVRWACVTLVVVVQIELNYRFLRSGILKTRFLHHFSVADAKKTKLKETIIKNKKFS